MSNLFERIKPTPTKAAVAIGAVLMTGAVANELIQSTPDSTGEKKVEAPRTPSITPEATGTTSVSPRPRPTPTSTEMASPSSPTKPNDIDGGGVKVYYTASPTKPNDIDGGGVKVYFTTPPASPTPTPESATPTPSESATPTPTPTSTPTP